MPQNKSKTMKHKLKHDGLSLLTAAAYAMKMNPEPEPTAPRDRERVNQLLDNFEKTAVAELRTLFDPVLEEFHRLKPADVIEIA
jgi:hypothetical protein